MDLLTVVPGVITLNCMRGIRPPVLSALICGTWTLLLALPIFPRDFAGAGELGLQAPVATQSDSALLGNSVGSTAALPEPPTLLLYGVVIVEPGNSLAFIHDGNSHSRIRRVREGQTIAGARVKAIFPDRVLLVYTGAEIDLRLWSTKENYTDVGLSEGDSLAAVVSPRPLTSAELSKPLIYRQRLYPQKDRPAVGGQGVSDAGPGGETGDNNGPER